MRGRALTVMLGLSESALRECCGSRRWGDAMAAQAPFVSADAVLVASALAFDGLSRADWLEAFAAHSAIGSPRPGDAVGAGEQSGVDGAERSVRAALVAGNVAYRERFGFVFLIRAAGRSAAEMLAALQARLGNSAEEEFATACAQQREITALRLEGMMSTP